MSVVQPVPHPSQARTECVKEIDARLGVKAHELEVDQTYKDKEGNTYKYAGRIEAALTLKTHAFEIKRLEAIPESSVQP